MEKILPCPFCGSRAEITYDDTAGYMGGSSDEYILCRKCLASGPYRKNKEDAIKAWNTRV